MSSERLESGGGIRYVAIGDSFSEGIGDGQDGMTLGWADRVARRLATWSAHDVRYANLAIRGKRISGVLDQMRVALSLEPAPTLVSVCAGGNDLLRPGFDLGNVVEQMRTILDSIQSAGAQALLLSPADPSAGMPLGGLVHARGDALANAFAVLAAQHDAIFVDISHDSRLRARRFWSDDRLHLNSLGHDLVADTVIAHLTGEEVDLVDGGDAARSSLRAELRYLRKHVLPWVGRRVMGRSSGDRAAARHPDWITVTPPTLR